MFKNPFSKKQARTDIDVSHFKKALQKELSRLESELKSVGRKNPDNLKDWEARATDVDIQASDSADIADNIENYENNTAVLKQLEIEYNDVKGALGRIKAGTYGICEVSNEPIEMGRLEAYPAARTCIAHKNTKVS